MQAATTQAQDRDHRQVLRAELSPSNEIPTKFSAGNGDFHGELNEDGSLSFQLSFSDLSSPATQAHIHLVRQRPMVELWSSCAVDPSLHAPRQVLYPAQLLHPM
jgi:hypothetical protein